MSLRGWPSRVPGKTCPTSPHRGSPGQYVEGATGERHAMLLPLHALTGDFPGSRLEVDFVPRRVAHFTRPCCGEDQELQRPGPPIPSCDRSVSMKAGTSSQSSAA